MIPLPSEPKTISTEGNVGVFEIEGLYPGYGVTIANSLRRVLLSSLEGAAPTQVKIKGIPHEFSTLDGVKEDAVMILLNLKQLEEGRFRANIKSIDIKSIAEKIISDLRSFAEANNIDLRLNVNSDDNFITKADPEEIKLIISLLAEAIASRFSIIWSASALYKAR